MKRVLIVLGLILLITTTEVKAAEVEIYHSRATAYCLKGITKTGTTPKEGRTIAAKKEWLGSIIVVFFDDGDGLIKAKNYLGTYQVEDVGGPAIQSGVLDIYIEDYERAREFGNKKVIFQVIKSEG